MDNKENKCESKKSQSKMNFNDDIIQVIEFPCPYNGNVITCADCFDCHRSKYCDIYATMLNEDNN